MAKSTPQLTDLRTPALLIDAAQVARNCERMRRLAAHVGVSLRPHLKTAKSAEVAELAVDDSRRITVSTVAEAEFFAARGFSDMTLAVCATTMAANRVAELARQTGATLHLLTDSLEMAHCLADIAKGQGVVQSLFIEIDSGEHRSGLAPDAPDLIELARFLDDSAGLKFAGVLTHGGHGYGAANRAELTAIAEQERVAVVHAAERIRADGIEVACVSAGSTPTILSAESFSGLTEIRPGCYTLFDLVQHALGVCEPDDIALSVLATVIATKRDHDRIIIDAGALALSKDRGAADRLADTGYGWVCDLDGNRLGQLHVAIVDQEHGYVEGDAASLAALNPGDQVRVIPNHACITAACHAGFQVIGKPEFWTRASGW